jgi:hypothetical protein
MKLPAEVDRSAITETSKPCSNHSGNGEREIKENDEGGEFNYDILKNFWKCHNIPPAQ